MALQRRPIRLALVVAAGCCALFLLVVILRVQRELRRAADNVTHSQQVAFTVRRLELNRQGSAFEVLPSVSDFSSGAQLNGELYLAGPSGLTVLGADGVRIAELRTGIELPVAQISAVTTGRLRGASEPQVLLATAGAGVLVLSSRHGRDLFLQQILPSQSDAADISALQVMPSGDLLLGTPHAGAFVFSGSTLQPLNMHASGHLQVTALAVADAATVLVGTRNDGVYSLHAGTVDHLTVADGMPDNQVESLLVLGSSAFVGTPLGVARMDLSTQDLHASQTLAAGVFAHTLAISADGSELDIGTLDQGIHRVPLARVARMQRVGFTEGATPGGRVDQFIAATGGVLVLMDGKLTGTGQASGGRASQELTDRNVSALAFDDKGSLFVGYFDHGLDVLVNGAVTHFEDDGLFCVNRLALDPVRKTMAAATANGLVLFDAQGQPRQTLRRRDGLISDHVTDVAFTRAGTVLATPAGLTFVNANGTDSLYAFQGLVNNHVYALAADPATDHVLAGTLGGLSLLDAEQVRRNLTAANSGLKHNWITALAQAATGDWLVGTYGAGVMHVSAQGVFTPIDLPAGVRHDLVVNPNALLVTQTHVYAGTLGQGMLVYSVATERWSMVTAGLPSLNVTAFAQRGGELYVGTDNGLVRVAEASL